MVAEVDVPGSSLPVSVAHDPGWSPLVFWSVSLMRYRTS